MLDFTSPLGGGRIRIRAIPCLCCSAVPKLGNIEGSSEAESRKRNMTFMATGIVAFMHDTEAKSRQAEAVTSVTAARQMPTKIQPPSSSIHRYLKDLRGTLETDTDRARRLLTKMLGKVTLRRDGARLLADVKGNLPGLLDVEVFGRAGAGSPSPALYSWPLATVAVA
ncbi:MAG TPA: hypothetical protein VJT32_14660 [bacterium]|nr:hypothetical protein [bacterium]